MKVCVGLPAYNAGEHVEEVLRGVLAVDRIDKVVVVDDGSTDSTAAAVQRVAGVELLEHSRNMGYGAAQRTLFQHFLDDRAFGEDDALVCIHSDGEMLPEEIPLVVGPLEEDPALEFVAGSRSPHLAHEHHALLKGVPRPPWKVALDKALTTYLNRMFGLHLTTYFGGFRAIRKRAVRRLPLQKTAANHFFDIQFLALSGAVLAYREVPISNIENHSVSNYSGLILLKNILLFGMQFRDIRALRHQGRR